MTRPYRKPRIFRRASATGRLVIGDANPIMTLRHRRNPVHRIATERKKRYTPAERELQCILNSLGNGALRGKFIREWVFSRWIIDFYIYEVRLAIEIDGSYHSTPVQKAKDRTKDSHCKQAGITLLRLKNSEIFGDRDKLVERLRKAYRVALQRSRESYELNDRCGTKKLNAPEPRNA